MKEKTELNWLITKNQQYGYGFSVVYRFLFSNDFDKGRQCVCVPFTLKGVNELFRCILLTFSFLLCASL